MKKMLWLIFLFVIFKTNAQEYFSVIAENGLSVRKEPDLKSDKIGKLTVGQDIALINKTGKYLTVNDDDKSINGEWFEVNSNPKGYVFSGYLLKKNGKPTNTTDCKDKLPCYSHISFDKFDLNIYNYQIEKNIIKKKDTVKAFEYVFNEIEDKLLQILPKNKSDSVSVSYLIVENINEQFDYRKTENYQFDEWEKNKVSWKGQEPFVELKNNLNFFRIPKTEYEEKEIMRKQNFKLKDTLVNLSGESENIATLIYKGKPCTYDLGPVILRIEIYSENGEKNEEFLVVNLSYGC